MCRDTIYVDRNCLEGEFTGRAGGYLGPKRVHRKTPSPRIWKHYLKG